MTIPLELHHILVTDPEVLSGAVRFKGTRVPVQALLDTLICHHTLEDFLEGYPDVTREQAFAVLLWEQNQARQAFGLDQISG